MSPAELIQEIDAHRFINITELPSDDLEIPPTQMDLLSNEIFRNLQDPTFDIAGFFSMLKSYCSAIPSGYEQFSLYCYSILMALNPSMEWATPIYHLAQDYCTPFQKLFISMQLHNFNMLHPTYPVTDYRDQLFYASYSAYRELLSDILTPIPKEERVENRVLVICSQFLSLSHAPTRTVLERCYTLQQELGKEILLINTMEEYSCFGKIPYFDTAIGNINKELFSASAISYQDTSIPFRQFALNYLYPQNTLSVVLAIRDFRPYEIIYIGGCHSIVSTLCAGIIPTISISVCFTALTRKRHQYISVGKRVTEEEYQSLANDGIEPERIIESTFCFKLNTTHGALSRAQLGLPEDKFLMGVIGIRLDSDVPNDFLNAMQYTIPWNAHLVFVGKFDEYNDRCEQFPWLREHSSFIGYQSDILAVWECLDLYVNPKRLGGGFSIIEAFHMNTPGVTIRFGDVAASAGADFCVDNYEEMLETIHRYITDPDFYREMVVKGKKRTEEVFDSKQAMEHILSEAEHRKFFF